VNNIPHEHCLLNCGSEGCPAPKSTKSEKLEDPKMKSLNTLTNEQLILEVKKSRKEKLGLKRQVEHLTSRIAVVKDGHIIAIDEKNKEIINLDNLQRKQKRELQGIPNLEQEIKNLKGIIYRAKSAIETTVELKFPQDPTLEHGFHTSDYIESQVLLTGPQPKGKIPYTHIYKILTRIPI